MASSERSSSKMLEWLASEPAPDVVQLPNALLASLAPPISRALKAPVYCTLQGEDLFLDGLSKPHRAESLDLIRKATASVDRFTAVSEYYADFMASYLSIPRREDRRRAARHQSRGFRPAGHVRRPTGHSPSVILRGSRRRKDCRVSVRRVRAIQEDGRSRERPARSGRLSRS